MIKKQAVEALDNSMRDIMDRPDVPFGAKTVVFGGEFRQVLPVVRKGSRAQIVDASLCRSYLWDYIRHLKLVCNMRAHGDPWFAEYVLRICNRIEEANVRDRSPGYRKEATDSWRPPWGRSSRSLGELEEPLHQVYPLHAADQFVEFEIGSLSERLHQRRLLSSTPARAIPLARRQNLLHHPAATSTTSPIISAKFDFSI
ncbi:hypothetical protein C2845_PM07G02090 [Panicum miliaceum]|uniref:ATP-dependent DNA helicase n=1 Tax=Panicum miliaceum TaxID=4540 RepID=A0A3L6SKF0_PANMI|nr:hypothetical protein C2845_PM07G02090 [Panicum miliaceum]